MLDKTYDIDKVQHIGTIYFQLLLVHMMPRISTEYLLCHFILESILHRKLPYYATVKCALAPRKTSVRTCMLASDKSRYMPGKTQENGN